mgnify:CR=1 FL=1
MSAIDKTLPDVLRVTEYILKKNKENEPFSVKCAENDHLNGIGRHRIAPIMRDICIEPEGQGSLVFYITIANTNRDNTPCRWPLNANTYFSYLSYLSLQESKTSNNTATLALWFAGVSTLLTFTSILMSALCG